MKKTTIFYWIFTGLLVLLMGLGSIPNIMRSPESVAMFQHLGYPAYLLPFLGVAKLLGCLAILLPGWPRLKEWAYAGLLFDLTGAMYSFISVGDPVSTWLPMTIGYVIIAGSYALYHKRVAEARAAQLAGHREPPVMAASIAV
jgi:uncharacterized membrane protein YphA (DoxX/SURF4 family)